MDATASAYPDPVQRSRQEVESPANGGAQTSHEVRFLDTAKVGLFRIGGVARLTIAEDRSWLKIDVARAFPVSDPDHYIGLLDGAGKDIGMIVDPGKLDAESRKVLAEELELRYFVPVVERIVSVKEEFGAVYWQAETSRGRKEIVVRNLKDSTLELPGNRVIITDVDGNRFEFPDIGKLDGESFGVIMRNL